MRGSNHRGPMANNAPSTAAARFSTLIEAPEIAVAPGVYDALTARIAEQAGFGSVYLSGASVAYTRFGVPDIGLVTLTEMRDVLAAITDRTDTPVTVDADNGHGNALNVQRTVRAFEGAGAAAIQLEDQSLPKRCGHLQGKQLVSTEEMAGKIKAACDARRNDATTIIARTDAIAVEGFGAAMARAEAYLEAGADMLFVEAPESEDELATIPKRFAGRLPVMANMVEGGATPMRDVGQLQDLGYSFVIFPGALVRRLAFATERFFAGLHDAGTTDGFRAEMHDLASLNALLGTDEFLERGAAFGSAPKGTR